MIHLDPIGTHLYYTKPSKTWSTQKLQAVQRAWIPSFQPDWYLKFAAVFCDGRIANGFSIVQVDTSRHTTWSNDQERTRHPTMKKTTPTNIPFHCWAWEISKKKKDSMANRGWSFHPTSPASKGVAVPCYCGHFASRGFVLRLGQRSWVSYVKQAKSTLKAAWKLFKSNYLESTLPQLGSK